MAFDRALAVLVITPEFFLPLRQLAIRYHAGSAGGRPPSGSFEILDTSRSAGGPRRRSAGRSRRRAVPAAVPPRRHPVRGRLRSPIDGRGRRRSRPGPRRSRRARRRPGRRDGRRQDHGREPAAPLHRAGRRPHHRSAARRSTTIDRRAWRAAVAWVPQRPHLFHGTVADNIRLARPDATDEEVARRPPARPTRTTFIEALPAGLRDAARRGRRPAQRRPAPAAGHRARLPRTPRASSSTRRPPTSTPRGRRPSAPPRRLARRPDGPHHLPPAPLRRRRRPRSSSSRRARGRGRPPAELAGARRPLSAAAGRRRRRAGRDHLPSRAPACGAPPVVDRARRAAGVPGHRLERRR